MSETLAPEAPVKTEQSFMERHHFLLRRLHSLSGIVPVGFFVIMHLFTNFQMVTGDFQHEVEFIHTLPALLVLEISIWLGIGFHAGLGLVYTFTSHPNVSKAYPYWSNWRYMLQRVTGMIALVFILFHIMTLRWRWPIFGIFTPFFVAAPDGHPLAAASTAMALQHSNIILALYIVGVFSVIYHWSNGLWTAAITWGLTISVNAQKRWGHVCIGLFVFLFVCSAGAIVASVRYVPKPDEVSAFKEAVDRYNTDKYTREKSIEAEPMAPISTGPTGLVMPKVGPAPAAAPTTMPAE